MQLEYPLDLEARQFNYVYENEMEVFEMNDLTIRAPEDAPCINVLIRGTLECRLPSELRKPRSDGSSPINFNRNLLRKPVQRKSH